MRMRWRVLLSLIGALVLCSDIGWAQQPKSGGILRMYHRENPPSMSIHEEATYSVNVSSMPIFSNLVIFDQHKAQNSVETIQPELATSWQWSEDGKALTFKLREGVKWHDGKPFTSADVKCTFDMLAGKGHGGIEGNPVASELLLVIRSFGLPVEPLVRLIEEHQFDLYNDPMPSMAALEGYLDDTSSALLVLAGRVAALR